MTFKYKLIYLPKLINRFSNYPKLSKDSSPTWESPTIIWQNLVILIIKRKFKTNLTQFEAIFKIFYKIYLAFLQKKHIKYFPLCYVAETLPL